MENYTILLVDDQDFNLLFLQKTLNDYTFITAKDGEQALELLKTTSPDLILLDVLMPGMSGYEVIKRLKSNDQTRGIPVIFITSLDSVEEEENGLNLGAVDYIIKPFVPTIVRARVKNALTFMRQQKLLEKMAHLDGLTEIPNRRILDETLVREFQSAVRYNRCISLIMIDIDFFKKYNDYYGHSKGDEALRKIAKIIQSCLRRPDDLVTRYGGEEFTVILPDTDDAGGIKIAEDIRQAVHDAKIPHEKSEIDPYLTISLGGYSTIPKPNQDSHCLIEKADACLYKAKNSSRNCVVWEQSSELNEMLQQILSHSGNHV